MTRQQAESLCHLVNSKDWQLFIEYKRCEINTLHLDLEWQKGDSATETQGRIKEIRNTINLIDNVNNLLNLI